MRGEGIVPVMDVNGNNGGFGGFGGNDSWAWIIVLFLIFGWGRNGFGGNGSDLSGALTRGDLCQDMNFNDLQNAVRSGAAENNSNFRNVDNAVCQLGYQNAQLINGVDMNIANNFGTLNTSLCQSFNNVAQQFNGLSSQLANCCCDIREGISGVNYNMAINNNALQASMCNNTRDIIDSQNAGTRAILDAITANRIEDKNAQIQAQQNEINALRLAASQEKQTNYLYTSITDKLSPCPIPAYLTCNPNANYSFNQLYGNGCGCGNY